VGSLHSARIVQRQRWWAAAFVALFVAAGCNGDDDADDTTEPSVESTLPDTTEAPPETTTARSTTTSTSTTSTTAAPTTTASVEELQAQIAADYQRSWQLRRELIANPTPDGLDQRLALMSVPGSESFTMLRDFVTELVNLGERVVSGTPDEFRVDVEQVELIGEPPHGEAIVTVCFVSNTVRVDPAGAVVSDFGIVASRSEDHLILTPNGWLPDGGFVDSWQGLGVTECPPA
jgi:hypothetical protein